MVCFERRLARSLDLAKKSGPKYVRAFWQNLRQAMESGEIKAEEFSLKRLFQEMVPGGHELVESFNPAVGVNGGYNVVALEAAGVVDTSAFSTINGQLFITKVLENWENPELLWPKLVEVIPTTLNGELLPGISVPADEIDTVGEGETYGQTGLSEVFIRTPTIPKKGTILRVTREAIFHDRTGILLRNAGKVALAMALNLEKRVLDCIFGITNTYNRNNQTSNTYLTSGAYVNSVTGNALSDYRSLETLLQLFENMTDPDTGEPIVVNATTLIVPTALVMTARRIVNAVQVRAASGAAYAADPTDNPDMITVSSSPLQSTITVESSPYVKARTSSASTYFFGDFKKGFALMENWPIQVVQAPANSEAEFERDVVAQFKVSHKATPAVLEPRQATKSAA